MAHFDQIGQFIGGSKTASGTPVKLFDLTIFPRSSADKASGQWVLKIAPDKSEHFAQCLQKFVGVTCRLGLTPAHFVAPFEASLSGAGPICVIADTNALYHGLIDHVLRARGTASTHVALPDQVMMELQRQREHSWVKEPLPAAEMKSDFNTWCQETVKHPRRIAAARALRRLRNQGILVHLARPPDALVRYFGGSAGAPAEEDGGGKPAEYSAPNYFRDRLILEAAYNVRAEMPHVPVWLLTADANLAAHADTEGFNVAYGWRADITHGLVTSPFVDPRVLRVFHVPVWDLLAEMIWCFRSVWLQEVGEPTRLVCTLPSDRRDQVLAELDQDNDGLRWVHENHERPWPTSGPASSGATIGPQVPAKAPTPQGILEALTALGRGPLKAAQILKLPESVSPYLRALRWATPETSSEVITPRGEDILHLWLSAKDGAVGSWYDFITTVAADLRNLPPIERLSGSLSSNKSKTDDQLAKDLSLSDRTVQTLATLANAFGICVRIQGKTWGVTQRSLAAAEDEFLQTLTRMQSAQDTKAIPVERLFTYQLDNGAMDLPNFRTALATLVAAGRVSISGTSPSETPVRVRVIRPSSSAPEPEHVEVNLGAGDWLVPGSVAQVVSLEDAQGGT